MKVEDDLDEFDFAELDDDNKDDENFSLSKHGKRRIKRKPSLPGFRSRYYRLPRRKPQTVAK